MSQLRPRRVGTMAAATLASGILLAGCAGAGGSDSATTAAGAVGIIGDQADGGTPVDGGTLTFAGFSPVASLDPTKTQPAGATGGTEMAGVYDLLVRYDGATESYVPQLAESLTESDDHLSWTIKLREGVTFSDGTPLTAEAVVASTNRYNEKRGGNSEVFQAGVKSVEATDPSTVVYHLNQAWTEFPALLTFGHGMIVAPTADQPDGTFKPIGAGAFTMETLNPGAELILKARADYWNGKPHLDSLKFIDIQGEQPKIEALQAGGVQMAFLRTANTVELAKAQFPGYFETVSLTDVGQINGREGRPGADLRVRKAMALAIDPDVIDQRAKEGMGMPGTEMFQPWSKWHTDVAGLTPDQTEATKLLDEAKAEGYNGKISYVSVQNQSSQAIALAAQSMLQAVGFDVTIEYTASMTDVVKRLYVDHDFDLSFGAYSIGDAAPYMRLFSSLNSTSSNNIIGLNDPEVDTLLAELQASTTDEDKLAKMAELQTAVNEKVPYMAWGAGANFVPWTDNVHGAVPSMDGVMLLDQAWVS